MAPVLAQRQHSNRCELSFFSPHALTHTMTWDALATKANALINDGDGFHMQM